MNEPDDSSVSCLQRENIRFRTENLRLRETILRLRETIKELTVCRGQDQALIQQRDLHITSQFSQWRNEDVRRIQQLTRSSAASAAENERLTVELLRVLQCYATAMQRIQVLEAQYPFLENPQETENLQGCNPYQTHLTHL